MNNISTGHHSTTLVDIDSTIADSLSAIAHGFRLASEATDRPLPPTSFISTVPGPPVVETPASLGPSDEQADQAFAVYMEYQHIGVQQRAKMSPGWPEFLRDWRAAGVQLATATPKGEYSARKTLDDFGLLNASDFIGAASDDGSRQAKAEVIEYTFKELGIETDETVRPLSSVVMVDDRTHDSEDVTQLGIPVAAVRWGYGPESERVSTAAVTSLLEDLNRVVQGMLYL